MYRDSRGVHVLLIVVTSLFLNCATYRNSTNFHCSLIIVCGEKKPKIKTLNISNNIVQANVKYSQTSQTSLIRTPVIRAPPSQ